MSIHWLCMQAPSIYPEVRQGMPGECVLCDPESFFQSTHSPAHAPCDVLVVELSDAQACFDPYRLCNVFQSAQCPLTLVLLPGCCKPQMIAWLNAGADRCLPRESDTRVVQAMIRAMLHRRQGLVATYTEHGLLRYDSDTRTLFYKSERVPLTERETLVASLLFQHLGRYVRHDEIMQALCAVGRRGCAPALVSLYIHRINKKIRPFGVHIGFKRGYGYRLHADLSKQSIPTTVEWLGVFKDRKFKSINPKPPQPSPHRL